MIKNRRGYLSGVLLAMMGFLSAEPPAGERVFSVGERLHYDIVFKGLPVGQATLSVTEGPPVNGRPTLQFTSTAKSHLVFDPFFKVRDENVSTVDEASRYSVAFHQRLNEGQFHADRRFTFDYAGNSFVSSITANGKTEYREGALPHPVHDVLSALYAVRLLPLQPGQDVTVPIFRHDGTRQMLVKIGAEPVLLKTAVGKVECLRVEPMLDGISLFRSKDNKLVLWMTNDHRKLPVMMEATVGPGLVRAKLDTP